MAGVRPNCEFAKSPVAAYCKRCRRIGYYSRNTVLGRERPSEENGGAWGCRSIMVCRLRHVRRKERRKKIRHESAFVGRALGGKYFVVTNSRVSI